MVNEMSLVKYKSNDLKIRQQDVGHSHQSTWETVISDAVEDAIGLGVLIFQGDA